MKKLLWLLVLIPFLGISQGKPIVDGIKLIPQGAPGSPIEGELYYDDTSNTIFVWDGSSWLDLGAAASGGSDGVVSNVVLNSLSLDFTGTNGGFNGSVDLSPLQDGTGTDDQNASEVSVTASGNLTSTDAQSAFEELQSDIDAFSSTYLPLSGGTMTGDINMGSNSVSGTGQFSGFAFNANMTTPIGGFIMDLDFGGETTRWQIDDIWQISKADNTTPSTKQEISFFPSTDYTGWILRTGTAVGWAEIIKFLEGSGGTGNKVAEIYGRIAIEDGVANDEAATVGQLNNAVGGITDDQTATEVPFTPYLTIGSTNTQAAIQELKDEVDNVGGGYEPFDLSTTGSSTAYTSTDTDKGKTIRITNADAVTISEPTGSYVLGDWIAYIQTGAGQLQFDFTMNGIFVRTTASAPFITIVYDGSGWFPIGAPEEYSPGPTDPTDGDATYVGRFDPTTIGTGSEVEDDAITTWGNLNGSGIADLALGNAILHIESGERQVDVSSTSGSHVTIPNASFNPTPQTDEFSITFKVGYDSGVDDIIFGKTALNYNTSGQILFYQSSGVTRLRIGGTESNIGSTNINAGDTVTISVSTSGMTLYINGAVTSINNAAIGTVTWSGDSYMGARNDGTSFNYDGSFSHLYIRNTTTSAGEVTTLHNYMNGI